MLERHILRFLRKAPIAAAVVGGCYLMFSCAAAPAYESLGLGTGALIGGDLTDPEDDGAPDSDDGYDAIFDSSDEQGFGGGEFAFNVFDNRLGPSNDKWCCGMGGGISEDNPAWVSAQFPAPYFLTSFTLSSANDTPDRDPIHWAIQGSNNGQDYTDIYVYDDDIGPWLDRLEVIEFSAAEGDFPVQTTSYEYLRFAAYNTLLNPTGAYYQVGEIEYFGQPDGVVPPRYVGGQGTIGQQTFEGAPSNEVYGPVQSGAAGWSSLLVDTDLTIDSHSLAEDILNDLDGEVSTGAGPALDDQIPYPVVDLAGDGGTFGVNYPYPNGVADNTMEDFAVRVEADVVIPAGTWTIGFGSDDGGRILIPGVEFTDSLNNDMWEDDEIRFEAVRAIGWTVGSFELTEPLETTITGEFYERGGGDIFEIAVIDDIVIEAASPDTGWELLGDGTFGWSVTTTGNALISADLSDEVNASRVWEFDVDGDTDAADQFVMENPDPDVFTTILSIDGVTLQIAGTGALANGDTFDIIEADQIVGTPIITSVDPAQTWTFDANTGQIMFGVGLIGDYNKSGDLDAGDLDLQAEAMAGLQHPPEFDLNSDGLVNIGDREVWVNDLKNTWIGDANLDMEFNSGDMVQVFVRGKYETGDNAGWEDGDWNGDTVFSSGDMVSAFVAGGYEKGTKPAVNAVPEPSSIVLVLIGLAGLTGLTRRR